MRISAACIRWAAGMAILTIVVVVRPASGKDHSHTKQAAVAVPVRVYNYTGLDDRTLAEAEREAARAFDRAGVTLVWHNCGSGESPAVSDAACSSADPSAIRVRLLKSVQNLSGLTDDATLGYAVGRMATVSCDMVGEISASGNVEVEYVLGDAVAHELGHLLMPGRPHAVAGIMHADWKDQDLPLMRQHGLNFLPAELALIRANAERREGTNPVANIAPRREKGH